jgi:hypothetical protein
MNEPSQPARLRSVLVCHAGADLNRHGLSRWLASWTDLAGIIVLQETSKRRRQRWRREISRVGPLRFLDVIAFRLWYRLAMAGADHDWEVAALRTLQQRYPPLPPVPVLECASINSARARDFIRTVAPDFMLARCKQLLREDVFTIPRHGTFVLHPGHCPRYRNAHGCFWAIVNNDHEHMAMTMLRIDRGIDTGPMFGYFTCDADPARESHIVIQHRVVLDNLDAIAVRLGEACAGTAAPVQTDYADSAVWGQPWLTRYLGWRIHARRSRR